MTSELLRKLLVAGAAVAALSVAACNKPATEAATNADAATAEAAANTAETAAADASAAATDATAAAEATNTMATNTAEAPAEPAAH
jgi:hypothetical protein